jgi:hypothetical protein
LLKKNKLSLSRVKKDTMLITRLGENTGQEMLRVEQYFKKSKMQWCIRFYLWQVRGKWYLLDAIRLEQDNTRIR